MGSALKIICVPVTSISQNCRILWEEGTNEAVVIDPGGESKKIEQVLSQHKVRLKEIWLTHSHFDHCGGVKHLVGSGNVPLYGHEAERFLRGQVATSVMLFGLPDDLENCPEPTQYLAGGEKLSVGRFQFEARFTPGHAPGHLCFYCEEAKVLIAGDTLFAGSIGRTDLPGGKQETLLHSIATQIMTLPDETKVLPGHGGDTTVGAERETNPFL